MAKAKFPYASRVVVNKNIVGIVLYSYNMFTAPAAPYFIYRIIVDAAELCHRVRNTPFDQTNDEGLFIEDLGDLITTTEQLSVIEVPQDELILFKDGLANPY